MEPPKTITHLRHRLPGWHITYCIQNCYESPHMLIAQRRKTGGRRIVMHVIHAVPYAYRNVHFWRGVSYVEARAREKRQACAAVFLGVRGIEDIWASE